MIYLILALAVASIWVGGIMFGIAFNTRRTHDFIGGLLGLIWGVTLIAMNTGV